MKKTIRWATVAFVALFAASGAFAQTWTPTAEGTYSWDTDGNWATTPFPNAIAATASLNIDLAGAQTINLNQAISVGTLNLGDTGSTYYGTTIAGNGGSLVMDVSTGSATISKATVANSEIDTISANITLNDNLTVNNAATAGALTLSGTVSGSTRTLTKTGAGLLNLNGATTLGSLSVGHNGVGGTVTMGSGATVSVGTSASNNLYVGTNSGGSNPVGNGTFNAKGLTAKVGIFGVGYSAGPTSAAGTSTGVLTLSGTGAIQADTVYVGVGLSSGAGGNFKTNGKFDLATGGTLNLSGTTGAGANLYVGWSFGNSNASAQIGSMDLSLGAANLTLSTLSVARGSNSVSGTGTLTLSGSHSNHLVVSGAGTVVTIGATNSTASTGTATLRNLDATSAITSTNNGTAIVLGANNNGTGNLTLSGGTLTITTTGSAIARVAGTGRLTLDNMTIIAGASNATSGKWITNLTSATLTNTVTFDSGVYTISTDQVFTGTGGLIKAGDGTLELSAANTFNGSTVVEAGTLSLTGSGSLANSATITVDAGATLDVSGTTAGLLNIGSGKTLGGGGTFNGNLTFGAGAQFAFSASETLNYTGADITFTDFGVNRLVGLPMDGTLAAGTYTLISGNVNLDSGVSNVGIGNAVSIGGTKSAYFQDGSLQLVVIPEPATLSLIGVIGIAMLLRRRIVRG